MPIIKYAWKVRQSLRTRGKCASHYAHVESTPILMPSWKVRQSLRISGKCANDYALLESAPIITHTRKMRQSLSFVLAGNCMQVLVFNAASTPRCSPSILHIHLSHVHFRRGRGAVSGGQGPVCIRLWNLPFSERGTKQNSKDFYFYFLKHA